MEYIKGIDGFRGFLVICVVVYHILTIFFPDKIAYFPGGFLAVEAFFVLSGFLILRLLQKIFSTSENRLKAFQTFLRRRFLRVFPALAFTVGFISILITIAAKNYSLKAIEESIPALSFSYNFYLLFKEIPYFQKYEEIKFFLHIWSLSIEFQLYILAGLIFLAAGNIKLPKVFVFTILILSSLSVNYIYFNILDINPDDIYLSTEARSFGFFIGGLLAIFEDKLKEAINEYSAYVFGVVGSLGLLFVFFSFSEYTDWFYPFGFLVTDLFTALVILGLLGSTHLRDSFNLLSWIGVRSYSLYLLHYPIFVLTSLIYKFDIFYITLVVLLLIPLSDLSYRLIEEPFRKLSFRLNFIPASFSAVFLLFLSSIFFLVDRNKTYSNLPQTSYITYEPQTEIKLPEKESPSPKVEKNVNIINSVNVSKKEKPTQINLKVFMIGDSVLLGASHYITRIIPNAVIDAKVGRQATEILDIIDKHPEKVSVSDAIIVHIGTNGYIRKDVLEKIVSKIGPDKKIYFLTVNAPVPWKEKVNENIKNMQKFPNVRIIEWDKYKEDDLFVTDKVHLSKKGIIKYASLIKSSLNIETSSSTFLITESRSVIKKSGSDSSERHTNIQPDGLKQKNEQLNKKDEDKTETSVQEILDSINQVNL